MKSHCQHVLAAALIALGSVGLLSSCQVTAAQTEVPSTKAKTEPVSVPVPPRQANLPRALWVWDATVITSAKQQEDLFSFCAKKGISLLYLSVGDIFAPVPLGVTDPKHVTAATLGKFLQAAHAKKIQVEALDGDPSFALEPQHAEALARFQKALDYNKAAASDQKLDGFQWDTEPYILPEFNQGAAARSRVFKQYLAGMAQMCAAAKAGPSLRLGYAIPGFWDEQECAVEYNGTTKPAAFHLLDLLNTLPSSYVVMMAYRDKALGVNGTVDITQGEVNYAAKSAPKVKVWIGQETLDVKGDPPSITFWQEGENALEQALGQIQTAYKDMPTVAGVAIHHWGSYRILQPGAPIDAVPVTAPITEPLTILTPKAREAVERRLEATGTAKPGGEGVKIEVSVRPEGDIWYSQGEVPLAENGTWGVTCRFGNETSPAGQSFEVRAQLKNAEGKVLKEQIVSVKTR